ncbi:MAG: 23S rRNA (guanosine(2251)-2'-O)-methyltransferase RlmB [Clostridia bacterium]|nr:23S rRNA (guanosine(2251)-2'-O)-methyltransferase RlmB [Clostridia bacterium]
MKVEGRNAVSEVIKSGQDVYRILVETGASGSLSKIVALARGRNIKVQYATKEALDRESEDKRHQGVIAYVPDYAYASLDDILAAAKAQEHSLIILADGIEDVHNLGSIIRVAECAGACGVVIPRDKTAVVTDAVIRISAGAAQYMKVARMPLKMCIEALRDAGFWVYALEADGESIYSEEFPARTALIIGGEDTGVRKTVREYADKTLSLPLRGNVNSLNASVALGIAAYEVTRKW